MEKLKKKYHSDCIFNSDIYNVRNTFNENGELIGSFICNEKHQGYSDRIHGGILSGIMDSSMTQCLFAHNIVAYTIDLNIKYSHPVKMNKEAIVKVKIPKRQNDFVYNLRGFIFQDDIKLISADARFWIHKDYNL
ncbi:MAG: PaaI family thioesterase [Spirochaetaceae bacterium]|nr:PaaI family thioesterase [Spirochaetaceae bacterium]